MTEAIREALSVLLSASAEGETLSLDRVGEALGSKVVGADEIAWLIDTLEVSGRVVAAPASPDLIGALRKVVASVRALRVSLGRAPTVQELAAETSLTGAEVRQALLLAKVMGR